ncbi:MAG: BamA/TamA family outer membrane protein, partial [Myxococcota bacterium]|nr:BamA/TamA family outer membrane protein [Myxococcota bacterium]
MPCLEAQATSSMIEPMEPVAEPAAEEPTANRVEVGVVPAMGYDSNTGFGIGVITNIAGLSADYDPYEWRIVGLAFLTMKEGPNGGIEFPLHDDAILLDVPNMFDDTMRLRMKLGFQKLSTSGYYGIGNAAVRDDLRVALNGRYHQYDWIHPHFYAQATFALAHGAFGDLDLLVGVSGSYDQISLYPGSLLGQDLEGRNGAYVRDLLVGTQPHGEAGGMVGLLWDTRDYEVTPSAGMFHEVSLRAGAGIGEAYGYAGVNVTTRFYLPLWERHLVLAFRGMADMLFGRPPFYEMARHGGLFANDATGGSRSVRGVLAQQTHGKIKVLTNLELRSQLFSFEVFEERFNFGAVLFFD